MLSGAAWARAGAGAQVVQRCADQCWHRIIGRPGTIEAVARLDSPHRAPALSRGADHLRTNGVSLLGFGGYLLFPAANAPVS